MPSEIVTELEIDAPPSLVWRVLCDFDAYPEWNPFVLSMRAKLTEGAKAMARFDVGLRRPLPMPLRIVTVDPEREFAWAGGTEPFMQGRHYFRLESLPNNRTRLIHGEEFTGVLGRVAAPMVKRSRLGANYDKLNQALAARCATLSS
ncbi:MAG: SRPBCC domain-containing protein [Polyangiaceae bacterium]|nr:SRPBCC domain-containing protein [Polyangiaceae bacterium]